MGTTSRIASKCASDFGLRGFLFWCLSVHLAVVSAAAPSFAQSQFPSESGFVEDVVLDNLPASTAVAFAPGDRIFIAVKNGIVRVAQNGVLLPTPFVDINTIVNRNTDRGIGGIAVDPQFPTRPYVYIFFTYDPPGKALDVREPRVSRLVRFTADAANNFNVAVAGSMEVILGKNSTSENIADVPPAGDPNLPQRASCMTGLRMNGAPINDCLPTDGYSHTAGTLIFGADGSLYASHGDGAFYDTVNTLALRAQNVDSLAGKILRIDPDTGAGLPGNPFYDAANPFSNRSRVWAMGLRNPFRIGINPVNGQAYIGDVGSSSWEEVNVGKGANFGWPCYEGGTADGSQEGGNTTNLKNTSYANFSLTKPSCAALYGQGQPAVRAALFTYRHSLDANGSDLGASVTGVAFYSASQYPIQYRNALFFADYAQHRIRYLTLGNTGATSVRDFATELTPAYGPVQLVIGPDSNLYGLFLSYPTKGQLRRFRYTGGTNNPPTAVALASPVAGSAPLAVSFVGSKSTDSDGQTLSYAWDFGDGQSSTEADPTHLYENAGTFEAILTVTETTAPFASSSSSVTIRTGVTPPKAFITYPPLGTKFRIGQNIYFTGFAAFDGGLVPASGMNWSIVQRHNQHEHLVTEVQDYAGVFSPTEHSDNTSYLICLRASQGEISDQTCLPIPGDTTKYTFASTPPGATITYVDEEADVIAPYEAHPIINSKQTILAAPVFASRSFKGWSDGVGGAERPFTVGTSEVTFTAVYENTPPVAKIRPSTTSGVAPLSVTLDGTSSTDAEGDALTYLWEFPDGTTSTSSNVQKTFIAPGVYSVQLTVTDRLGAAGVSTVSITALPATGVNKAPTVSAGLPLTAPFGQPLTIQGSAMDDGLPTGILSLLWSRVRGPGTITFGTATTESTTATFSKAGTYLLKFEASDGDLRTAQNTLVTLNPQGTSFGVSSISLIDAATGATIPGFDPIPNGAIIRLSALPTANLNLRANVTGSGTQSVSFLFDAVATTFDNTAPFAVQPSTGSSYPAWAYTKKRYLLTAVPFPNADGTGNQGNAYSLEFTLK